MKMKNYQAKLRCEGTRRSVFIEISATSLSEAVSLAGKRAAAMEDYPGAEVVACGLVRARSWSERADCFVGHET